MDYRITLRGELEKAIDETGCTLSQLKKKGGTQIGNLSARLRGKTLRPITMKQLDKLTEVLGLPEGYYEFYLRSVFTKTEWLDPEWNLFYSAAWNLEKLT
ncbi:hypothetical protein P7H17_20915 [Paenibacillus larvae]|nr:hypothetical protein [Paenibacillus larvae]MDT2288029.1 hypothetical protein [Paenibacillus larvae]